LLKQVPTLCNRRSRRKIGLFGAFANVSTFVMKSTPNKGSKGPLEDMQAPLKAGDFL
jgi:hypothetical protein